MDHARDAFSNSDEATTATITPVMEEEKSFPTAVTLVFQIYEAITASITPVMEGVTTYHARDPGELVGIICDEAITAPITAVIHPLDARMFSNSKI